MINTNTEKQNLHFYIQTARHLATMNTPLVLLMKNVQETSAEQTHFNGVPISQIQENLGIKKKV